MEQFQIVQSTITVTEKRSKLTIQSSKHTLLGIGVKPAVDVVVQEFRLFKNAYAHSSDKEWTDNLLIDDGQYLIQHKIKHHYLY